MQANERTVAVGIFDERAQARDAVQALKDAGFAAPAIGLLMPDPAQLRVATTEVDASAPTGSVAGGVLGGLAGWLVGLGVLAIPGVGPLIAAGTFGAALGGVLVGASLGSVGGALVGIGIPEDEAQHYEQAVRRGATLITVRADGRYVEAHGILRRAGAYDTAEMPAGEVREVRERISELVKE
jgi:hypothetical protein